MWKCINICFFKQDLFGVSEVFHNLWNQLKKVSFCLFQVIARIFFVVNRSWSGLITLSELRKSNLLATIRILEEEEDINQITDFFSYEHFYVIYCKFWELDKDHDLFIDREDLSRHNDHGKQASKTLFKNKLLEVIAQQWSENKLKKVSFL